MSPEEQAREHALREKFYTDVQKFRLAIAEVIVNIKANINAYREPHGQYVSLAVLQLVSAKHWAGLLQGLVNRESMPDEVIATSPVAMTAEGLSDAYERVNAIFQSLAGGLDAKFVANDPVLTLRLDKHMDQLWRTMTDAKMWLGQAIESVSNQTSTQPSPIHQGETS